MSEYAAGDSPASPTPTPMRVTNKDQKLLAKLHRPVKKLQTHNSGCDQIAPAARIGQPAQRQAHHGVE